MTKRKSFLFIDLAQQIDEEGGDPKPFDGMAAGTFTDMWGREIEFKREEMATYALNTAYALESTKDSAGNIVGFPIDAMNHDNGAAAGWIVGVAVDETGGKLRFTPRWNAKGRELIGSDTMRFFSPTVDMKSKTVIGGSLTNWPATRTEANQILLKPVELSEQMFTPEMPEPAYANLFAEMKEFITGLFSKKPVDVETSEAAEGETEAPNLELPKGDPIMPDPIELSAEQRTQLEALVQERANSLFQQMVETEKRKNHILDYSRAVIGKGLPVEGEALTAFLSTLTPEQLEQAETLFSRCADTGKIDFEELGHNKTLTAAQPLPDWAKAELKKWIAAGYDLDSFFTANAVELGAKADYNLSEFEQEK